MPIDLTTAGCEQHLRDRADRLDAPARIIVALLDRVTALEQENAAMKQRLARLEATADGDAYELTDLGLSYAETLAAVERAQ